MKILKKIILIFFMFNIIFILTGCSEQKENELKDKTISELGYLNIKIIDMLNALNNISYENYKILSKQAKLDDKTISSKEDGPNKESGSSNKGAREEKEQENEKQEDDSQDLINTTEMVTDSVLTKQRDDINWDELKSEIEILNESWSIICLDLYSQNVDKSKILEVNTKLDKAMIAIKNEDKKDSLSALSTLYKSIPKFLEEIGANKNIIKIRQTQMYVINAYSLADDMENEEIKNNIKKAFEVFKEVIEDTDYTKDKTFKTNKAYILLNDLKNSLASKDKDIFLVKYKNFMETINEI